MQLQAMSVDAKVHSKSYWWRPRRLYYSKVQGFGRVPWRNRPTQMESSLHPGAKSMARRSAPPYDLLYSYVTGIRAAAGGGIGVGLGETVHAASNR